MRDHLGSIDAVTDENGLVVERLSYDALGKRRQSNWQDAVTQIVSNFTTRGFTGHEQLDGVGLIHMNGRVYDPLLGRFLSADPHIQSPLNLQSHNRYSYVLNNPLSYTDPSGFFFKSLFKKIRKLIKRLVRKIVRAIRNFVKKYARTIAAIAITAYAPQIGLNAYAAGFGSGLIASGGDIKAGLISAATAGAFGEAHSLLEGAGPLARVATHAAIGGVSSVANGGKFFEGAISAGVTQFASVKFGKIFKAPTTFANRLGNAFKAAVIGGTAAAVSGGKFANGAITGAFSRAFNDDKIIKTFKNYLAGRPLNMKIGKGNGHLFIATDAEYVGDPDAIIYSFGDSGGDTVSIVDHGTTGFSEGTHEADLAYWNSLSKGSNSVVEFKGNAIDISILATGLAGGQEYSAYPPLQGGVNSNSAAQAIANYSNGSPVPTPANLKYPGSRQAGKVKFWNTP